MENFLLIGVSLLAGWICQRIPIFPKQAQVGINAFVIYVSLPAISLYHIPKIAPRLEMLIPFLSGIIVMGGALLFFLLLHRFLRFNRQTLGCLLLVCGLGNTSFVGYPVTRIFFGEEGMQYAIFADQSAFLMLSLVGVSIAAHYSGGKVAPRTLLQKIMNFPPFWAFLLALLLLLLEVTLPDAALSVCKQLGDTLTPLALFSVGFQLRLSLGSGDLRNFMIGLSYKLGLAPALVFGICWYLADPVSLMFHVTVIESAMPPMVTASIIAAEYHLNPPLANLLVGGGLLLASLTLAAWYAVLV